MDKLRTTAQEAIRLYEGAQLCLEGFLAFEPGLVMSKAKTCAKFRHSGAVTMPGKSADHAPSLSVIPWHSPYNSGKKHGKSLSQGCRKVPAGHDAVCRHDHFLSGSHDKSVVSGLPWDVLEVRGQHSVSVGIFRAAQVRGSPHQLTLSQISQSEI